METKVKRREWVKTAAIIFLAILLVLTFFSNTIMKHSLAEVATQQVSKGTISPKVRGMGIVVANETYSVTVEQTREVDSVLVKEGQEVSVGDVLLILSGEESAELSSAQDVLSQLRYSYQQALISAADADYSKENRDIEKARQALEEAQETANSLFVDENLIWKAEVNVIQAESAVSAAQRVVKEAQAALDSLGGYSAPDDATLESLYTQMVAKQDEIRAVSTELESARLLHGDAYGRLAAKATEWIKTTDEYLSLSGNDQTWYIESMLPVFIPAAAEQCNDPNSEDYALYAAFQAITRCEQNLASAQAEYDSLYRKYNSLISQDNSYIYNQYDQVLQEAKTRLTQAQEVQTQYEQVLANLQKQQTEYEAAQKQVETCQTNLENLLFALEEQQKADSKTQQLQSLNLQELSEKIAKQQAIVNELLAEQENTEITAKVSGIVDTVHVTAGKDAVAGMALVDIQVGDMGYSMSVSVTNEQARKVKVGDVAEVTNNRYGDQIGASLRTIRTDPQDPLESKILDFNVSGDVTVGAALTVEIAQRSVDYDYVIPNSALRSDANGSFVLTVTTKNSPLGNRYIATRVDVTVLASDDASSAVTGALGHGSYVITTSSKPITSGDKVQMPG